MAAVYHLLVVLFITVADQAHGQNTTMFNNQNGGYESMAPDHPATISVRAATLTSPGYPGHYPANLSSVFLSIEVPPDETGGFVSLHFLSFDLQTCQFCTCDYLHIDSIHMSLCGDSLPPMFTNNIILIAREKIVNNLITLHFRSDERSEGAGFAIQYEIHTFRPPTTPATNPGASTQCPLVVCPTCRPDEGHTMTTENNCAKCVCASTTTQAPASSVCPVAVCPSCTSGHRYVYDSNCPRCVCLHPTTASPPRCKSPLLHMLMRISQHAEWIEMEVKELKQEVDFAENALFREEMMSHVTDTLTNPIDHHEQPEHHDVIQKWQKLKMHLQGRN